MFSVAFAYLIHWNGDGLALQWAFLIVFGFYLLLAALLVFVGVRKVKQVRRPEKAIEQAARSRRPSRASTDPVARVVRLRRAYTPPSGGRPSPGAVAGRHLALLSSPRVALARPGRR